MVDTEPGSKNIWKSNDCISQLCKAPNRSFPHITFISLHKFLLNVLRSLCSSSLMSLRGPFPSLLPSNKQHSAHQRSLFLSTIHNHATPIISTALLPVTILIIIMLSKCLLPHRYHISLPLQLLRLPTPLGSINWQYYTCTSVHLCRDSL